MKEQNKSLTFYHVRYLLQSPEDKLYVSALDAPASDHCEFIKQMLSDEDHIKTLSAEYLGETRYDLVGNIVKYDNTFPSAEHFFSCVCENPVTSLEELQ